MSSGLRSWVRRARSLPVVGAALHGVDRVWWAHVIRRADLVDAGFVAAQLGRPVSSRAAVRRYVRGGFRGGFSLNPLFSERTVSRQLPDDDRVPAMYAYLVNDRRSISVSPAWDAPRYAELVPASLDDPGGPIGHAWRRAVATGTIDMGHSPRRAVAWRSVAEAADNAASGRSLIAEPVPHTPTVSLAYLCRVGAGEPAADRALAVAREVAELGDTDVVIALEAPRTDDRVLAAVLAAAVPGLHARIVAVGEEPVEQLAPAAVTVVRVPGDDLDVATVTALAAAATDGPVAPLSLAPDGTIASAGVVTSPSGSAFHLLAGHPIEDSRSLPDIIAVSGIAGATRAWARDGAATVPRTLLRRSVTGSRPLPAPVASAGPVDVEGLVRPAGFEPADVGSPFALRRRGTAVPRWAIKTAAPAGRPGESWGDTHFARALAAALRRTGVFVSVDAFPARDRATGFFDDVTVVIRGPHRIAPPRRGRSVLWIISHPDEITADEVSGFDLVFAASDRWARTASERFGRPVVPLLQCTDATRFRPMHEHRDGRIVFVGTARGIARPVVVEPLRAGVPVSVYGPDWRGYIPASAIAGTHVPNDELPRLYETAGVVLNDHWPAMQREGFVSNRLFDVVAAGGRALSDHVDGIAEIFDTSVREYASVPELLRMLHGPLDALFPDEVRLREIAVGIREAHSFDARAQVLRTAVDALV